LIEPPLCEGPGHRDGVQFGRWRVRLGGEHLTCFAVLDDVPGIVEGG
jgi:hypothetical protein